MDEAYGILNRLSVSPSGVPADATDLRAEMSEIKQTVDEERAAAAGNSYKALLKNGTQKFRYRTLLGIGGQFMQQLSGKYQAARAVASIESEANRALADRSRNQSDNLLCSRYLPAVRGLIAQFLAVACRLQWDCVLLFLSGANLDARSTGTTQAYALCRCRSSLLYGDSGRDCVNRQNRCRHCCHRHAVPLQLLLRCGVTRNTVATTC